MIFIYDICDDLHHHNKIYIRTRGATQHNNNNITLTSTIHKLLYLKILINYHRTFLYIYIQNWAVVSMSAGC